MRIGLHTSTSDGLEKSALRAIELGADTFQIFSSSPRMWRAAMPAAHAVTQLKQLRAKHDLAPLVIHGNYLINLASFDAEIRAKSIQSFRGEVMRALAIGADHLVFHPGSARDYSRDEAIQQVAHGLQEATRGLAGALTLLIENTAGQGNTLGHRLEELAEIRQLTAVDFAVGYCIDTCHAFAAGYDIGEQSFMDEVERVIGWANIPVIHANDSQGTMGSRLDRHANIGDGAIGRAGFARFLQNPAVREKAFIIETPYEDDGDQRDLAALREFSRAPAPK